MYITYYAQHRPVKPKPATRHQNPHPKHIQTVLLSNTTMNTTQSPLQKEQQQAKKRTAITVILSVALIGVFAGVQAIRQNTPQNIPLEGQPSIGNPNAPVKVVVFEDFKCTYCKTFETTIFPDLEARYIRSGKIQYTFINHLVVSPNGDSKTAAIAGECVTRQKPALFFPFLHSMFNAQMEESTTWATPKTILYMASKVPGINTEQLETCLNDSAMAEQVKADQRLGEKLGLRGTPTIFVNGVQVKAALQPGAVRQAIEQAL